MMDTKEQSKAPQQYIDSVFSGLALYRISDSLKSADRMNYSPMVTPKEYGDIVAALGKAAGMGAVYAHAAHLALLKASPFLNRWQIVAAVVDAFSEVHRNGWFDTASATGPESGRHSDHEHELTEVQAIMLLLIVEELKFHVHTGSVPGVGWALRAMIEERNIHVWEIYLPNVAKQLKA